MQNQQESGLSRQVGEYRLVRKIGIGGFGTVYLAEHVHKHIQVAVKVLHTPLAKAEDFKDFVNEAGMIGLHHPHIVSLLDFGFGRDDQPFLVMEYAPEGTLRDRHPKGERVALPTVVSYVNQIASALQYLHDQHIIHRDITPANILVSADGTLLVSDFGIAKFLEHSMLMSEQARGGTSVYMAPEQHIGRPCFASDQYALAVMIYEWICGVCPFEGTALGLTVQHMNIPPAPLRDHLPELSEAVESVVLKALAKSPQDRFESVQKFADALHEAMQPSPRTVVLKPLRRRWSRRMVLFTGTILVGGGITWFAFSKGIAGFLTTLVSMRPAAMSTPSLSGTTLHAYRGHPGAVYSVAWSPDGKRLASAGVGDKILVWDTTSGDTPLFTYSRYFARVYSVAWSPDSTQLVSGGINSVHVWDASTGNKFPRAYDTGYFGQIYSVAWSPDGKRLASAGDDHTVQVWDASSGDVLFNYTGHLGLVWSVAWSPNSKRLASAGDDHTVQVWDASSGGTPLTYKGHSNVVRSVAWSPDGKRLASAGDDHTVQVWDASSGGAPLTYKGHSNVVRSVAWSPDSKWLASASDDYTVQVWDASTGSPLFTYRGHSSIVCSVAWSPNVKRLASAGYDATVQVWQVG